MTLAHPTWLLIALLYPALLLFLPRHVVLRPLRILLALLLALILAEPQIRLQDRAPDLWVLVDRSLSNREEMDEVFARWWALLEDARPQDAALHRIDYAEEPRDELARQSDGQALTGYESRLDTALRQVLLRRETDTPARVLVLSDGYSTEPLKEVGTAVMREGLAVDYRLIEAEEATDVQVSELALPGEVRPGQLFRLSLLLEGPDGEVPYRLLRDGQPVHEGTAKLSGGSARLALADRVERAGAYRYAVEIEPETDAIEANNRREAWLRAQGNGRILLLSKYRNDPLADLLAAAGAEVELVHDFSNLHEGSLIASRLVILNDVPAHVLPIGFNAQLTAAIREQGTGLLMVGGPNSFGSGGYFGSALAEVLPVSMELRQEHRRLATALVLVLDRSGSMSMTVDDASGQPVTKMQLANAGAVSTAALLGNRDGLAVLAADTEAHVIVPMTTLTGNREEVFRRVGGITSMGGGIYVFKSLLAAWEQLQEAQFGQRHVILFSDANDSEAAEGYEKLLPEMRADGVTVSVIALGTPEDVHAELLKHIAELGGGRIFFTDQAQELPALFSQETVTIARSAFVQDVTPTEPTLAWSQISSAPLEWLPEVPGYNLGYLRDNANGALFTTDAYQAPLVAFWQQARGRVMAVTFPVVGDGALQTELWGDRGAFLRSIVDWTARPDVPAGLAIESHREGSRLTFDFYYSDDWIGPLSTTPPALELSSEARKLAPAWERMEPGHFRTSVHLPPGETFTGGVSAGSNFVPAGPFALSTSAEFVRNPQARRELAALSNASGGTLRQNLADSFQPLPGKRSYSLRPYLLGLLLLLALADAALTRLQLRTLWWRR
ncbi:MAG: VWA domain-containing protein [Verrucomicrobiota bacterium JB022]|nr:VWA domain-containing protein [Verrucomicrobiota bacterium JB022]